MRSFLVNVKQCVMLRSCYRFQVTCNDVKHTSLLWSILPFFFHSPVLFHQKWTEMIDTGYRDPWGETRDFPRPHIQNRKLFSNLSMWLYRYSYRLNSFFFFHIYYIFTVVIVKVKVYFVFSTSALSHASWCCWFCGVRSLLIPCSALLWFTTVICWGLFLHLSFSKQIPPSLNNSNHIPLTLRRSQARALAEYLPLEPCSPPLAGSACHCVLHGAVWAAALPSKSLCWDATDLHLCFLCISGSQS